METGCNETQPGGRPWLPFLGIIAASALAHLWCLGSQFYMDDITAIVRNEKLRNGNWGIHLISWTYLGYFLQYKLFGMSSVAFHAVNWLLHTSVACVLFAFGRDFTGQRGIAWFAALLFAVHPLASEIPNYARTQDLAWVTLFSLLASWALMLFLRDGDWKKLLWLALAFAGATMSKGPGMFHAAMMTGAVGLVSLSAAQGHALRKRLGWLAAFFVAAISILWFSGILPRLWLRTEAWGEPRFIGHAFTLARVFWEFAWRAVIPVSLSSDHQIAETLVPPGSGWFSIPDKTAMLAAASMLVLAAVGAVLAWRKPSRTFGVCLLLFVGTILFRVAYLIPEFMPEYRIYPGMPWFCLGAAIALAWLWRTLLDGVSPRAPAVILLLVFAGLSAKRSFVWHDLERLTADVLKQYPAQARAVWEMHDHDMAAGRWRNIIDRQRNIWPAVFRKFMEENRRLMPRRELPSGNFALADVACAGRYAIALFHVESPAVGIGELRMLEARMLGLGMNPEAHRVHWSYLNHAKAIVFEQAGNYRAALEVMSNDYVFGITRKDIERVRKKLADEAK